MCVYIYMYIYIYTLVYTHLYRHVYTMNPNWYVSYDWINKPHEAEGTSTAGDMPGDGHISCRCQISPIQCSAKTCTYAGADTDVYTYIYIYTYICILYIYTHTCTYIHLHSYTHLYSQAIKARTDMFPNQSYRSATPGAYQCCWVVMVRPSNPKRPRRDVLPWGTPKSSISKRMFRYKPSSSWSIILGNLHLVGVTKSS